jgi:hypothetical protein
MMGAMRRTAVSAVSVLALGALSACSLIPGSSSDLEDALEVMPADATSVTFVGRAATAERLDVDDVETGADEDDLDRYLQAVRETAAATRLTDYLVVMQEAAFTDLDVVWEISGQGADGGPWTAWKTDDGLDLDDIGDDLVDAGYEESEVGGQRAFRADIGDADPSTSLLGDRYPVAVMGEVLLVPDEHLVLTGPDTEAVLDVVEDDQDSLVDAQDFEDVVDAADDAELAHLRRDVDCAAALGGSRVSPEQVESLADGLGLEDLGRPESTGFFVHGNDAATTTVLQFADDDAAEADATVRAAWIEDGGALARTQEPIDDVAEWDAEADGPLVRIDHEFDGGVTMAVQVALAGDGFALCAP